jgi:zinc/manganese transport system substrate-binding protein
VLVTTHRLDAPRAPNPGRRRWDRFRRYRILQETSLSTFARRLAPLVIAALGVAVVISGCGAANAAKPGTIGAVGAENEYANVIGQIGGKYVTVNAIESNPATDPHAFEASPSVAQEVSSARLVVQNGLGYDSYMNKIESASPSSSRTVIDVQQLLGLPDSTPNPHLWYKPTTMPLVVKAIVSALSKIQPEHASYFAANAARFDRSLRPWYQALAQFKAKYPGTPVATTEPVGDYMLQAAGAANLTPFTFQADIMNGVDPAPQSVALENGLFAGHRVKAFLYNRQVTSSLTVSILQQAKNDSVPVVGLYETMPTPGYSYQSWMLAEVKALQRAVADKASTEKL